MSSGWRPVRAGARCSRAPAYYFGAGLAICIGYHRVLSHRSAVLSKGLERLLVTLGLPGGHADPVGGEPPLPPRARRPARRSALAARRLLARAQRLVHRPQGRACRACSTRSRARCGSCSTACTGRARTSSTSTWPPTSPPIPGIGSSAGPVRTSPSRSRTSSLFFGGAFWLFGWAGVAALWLTLVAIFNLGDAIDSVAHIVGDDALRRDRPRAQPLVPRPPLPRRRVARAPPPLSVERPPRPRNPGSGTVSWRVIASLARLGLARNVRVPSAEQIRAGARRRAGGDPCRRRLSPPRPPRPRPGAAAPPGDDFVAELGTIPHDRRDPDQWWALYTDRSLPLDPQVKAALVLDARSFSRRVLLPLLRPLARTPADPRRPVPDAGAARADVVVPAAPADLLRPPHTSSARRRTS